MTRRRLCLLGLPRPLRCRRARGFSIVEALVSMVIVSVIVVSALETAGAMSMTRMRTSNRALGARLAEDLMAEICRQDYEDADLAPGSFGLGADEVGDGSRLLWEDVDDYDGWTACPPQQKDGTELPISDQWARSASVRWILLSDVGSITSSDTRAKEIVVTVTYAGTPVASLTAVRAAATRWTEEIE